MKHKRSSIIKKTIILATCLVLIPLLANNCMADGNTATLGMGKTSFENKCNQCHSLKAPLVRTDSRAGWDKLVKQMVIYGAQLNSTGRENVVTYLNARSTFSNYCSTCHDLAQVVTKDSKTRDWKMTIDQMKNHFQELSLKQLVQDKKQITDREKSEISDLLTVLLVP